MAEPHPVSPSSDPVARQYEQWPYPAPVADLDWLRMPGAAGHYAHLHDLFWAYWPGASTWCDPPEILVAGCGTLAAPAYAYLYPRSHVLGIDVSATSLEHADRLRQRHRLANLQLLQFPIEEVGTLGQSFDFITCHGVLHHMADPAEGLRALGTVLQTDGVLSVMVYGRYGRLGVYLLQELFELFELRPSAANVEVVRQALMALPPGHPAQRYLRLATDLDSPNGLVDTFLHPRDRAFSAGECVDLVEKAGLVFQGWDENGLYFPDVHLPPQHPLLAQFAKLEEKRLWQAVDLFYGSNPGHWFYVCGTDRNPRRYRIAWEAARLLECRPFLRGGRLEAGAEPGVAAVLVRPPFPPLGLNAFEANLLGQFDAERRLADCLAGVGVASDTSAVEKAAALVARLWRMGHLLVRLPGE